MLAAMSEPTESRRQRAARRAGEFPDPPPPLPRPVIDSHTHLDITVSEAAVPGGGDDPVAALIDAAATAGVDRLVQVGVDVASSRWSAEMAARHPALLATVALHPNEAPRLADLDEALREIEALAAQERVRGIGETGMDRFRTGEEGRAAQEASFRAHIAIAKRYGKALVIHDREAHDDVLRILDDEGAPDRWCCTASPVTPSSQPSAYAGASCSASPGPSPSRARRRCARRPGHAGRPVAGGDRRAVPDADAAPGTTERLVPDPADVRSLAETTGTDLDELCAAISATGERMFGPW